MHNEYPVHSVSLPDYYIGETEVTQELWQAVMGSNPSTFTSNKQQPVDDVSWNDCQEFIKKLNQLTGEDFRLPIEEEWEYAARGGNKSKGYKYSGSNSIREIAWYRNNSNGTTHAVATKLPNELGLFDMSGNVWEWCQSKANADNTVSCYILRGGSWYDDAQLERVSCRVCDTSNSRYSVCGLRLAKSINKEVNRQERMTLKPETKPNIDVNTFNIRGVEFKMVKVQGGTFSMGGTLEQSSDAKDFLQSV